MTVNFFFYKAALGFAEEALEITIEIGAKGEESWARRLNAECYLEMGDLDKAKTFLDDAYEIAAEVGEREEMAECRREYGNFYMKEGDKDAALESYKVSLDIFEEIGMVRNIDKLKNIIDEIESK